MFMGPSEGVRVGGRKNSLDQVSQCCFEERHIRTGDEGRNIYGKDLREPMHEISYEE